MTYKLRILSLGAGVQSTTLLMMAEKGLIEPFNCALFADTGWESPDTYLLLKHLKSICKTPIITVKSEKGSIYDWQMNATFRDSKNFSVMPFFTLNNGKKGITKRQCTDHFKLVPIRKEIRNLLGVGQKDRISKGAVQLIIGISWDERHRVKNSGRKYIENNYPLVDKKMDRDACVNFLWNQYQLNVPKSSCIGCPFHNNDEWRLIKNNGNLWNQVITLDNKIREQGLIHGTMDGTMYLHNSCTPLENIDLRTPEERGQTTLFNFAKDEKIGLFLGVVNDD